MRKMAFLLLVLLVGFSPRIAAEENDERQPFLYDDAGKRDPLWPLVNEAGAIISYDEADLSASDMILTGVIAGSKGRNIAVINGEVVKEGDKIGLFVVERVTPKRVILNNGQEKTELLLQKEE